MAMFIPLNEKEIAIPTPWTSYRNLLLEFKNYLGVTGREKEFKLYFRGSIPTKNWSVDIVEYLRILEEADVVNMYRLEILDYFLKTASDSNNIRSTIREFQYRLHLVQTLLNHAEVHNWMCSPPVKIERFKIPDDLNTLLEQWRQELERAPDILTLEKIYSQAAQRIKKTASQSDQNDYSASREALFIAEFLMKIAGIPEPED